MVRLLDRIGEMNFDGTGGYTAVLPVLTYLLWTKPGYDYSVERRVLVGSTTTMKR